MTTVKIGFNPNELNCESEAWPAFSAGGITLKFWALFKSRHITSQHFRPALVALAEYLEKAFDPDEEEVAPYTNIDEFMAVLDKCGFRHATIGYNIMPWIIKHWDYFNLNIQKKLTIEYEAVETVVKKLEVAA